MAQFLDEFEEQIEPLISKEAADKIKGVARRKFNALATDVVDLIELGDDAMNGHARDIKDRVYPDSAPPSREGVRT